MNNGNRTWRHLRKTQGTCYYHGQSSGEYRTHCKIGRKVDKLNEKVDTGFKSVTEEIHTLRVDMVEMRGDIKTILSQLKTEEIMDTLESMFREHIEACEKAKA